MPTKRKAPSRAPSTGGHPSLSSVDIPLKVKKEVKEREGSRCWLCDQKALKALRPLQICHVFPQARTRRRRFLKYHKVGRIQLTNIHDPANLITLCLICHIAYNDNEWTFLPKDMTALAIDVESAAQTYPIQEISNRRDIEFQRWRLEYDEESESEASKDEHYVSAFIKDPSKMWPGDVGIVIVANLEILGEIVEEKNLQEAVKSYDKLFKIWTKFSIPCTRQDCSLCKPQQDDKESNNNEDDDHDGGGGGDDENDHDDEEEERKDNRDNQKRQSRRKIDDCEKSAPYDKSVPFSHRKGYTWHNTTANELTAMWQGLPYRKNCDGTITITGPSWKHK